MTFAGGKKFYTEIDQVLGMVIFTSVRPFATFDSEEIRLLVSALDPKYHIPGINKIINSILPNCYVAVHKQVFSKLAKSQYPNVSIDESTDIRKRQVLNILMLDSQRSYCLALRDLEDETATTENLVSWVITEVSHYFIK
jgi:hypothetical protein